MWDDIYDVTLNVLIGIGGGIFSSIIVSYIFLIDSEYKAQMNHVKELFDSINGIVVMSMTYEQFKKTRGKKKARKITSIDDSGKPIGNTDIVDVMNTYWNKITSFYSNYEPWDYKYELRQVLNEVLEVISDGKYMVRTIPEDYDEIRTEFERCISDFDKCQRNYKKGVTKRFFSSKLIHVMGLILIGIIVLFVIAA